MSHPMQRVVREGPKIAFRGNRIIQDVLTGRAKPDMDVILKNPSYKKSDKEQLAQLMGYSVAAFTQLSFTSPRMIERADAAVLDLLESEKPRNP